MFSWLQAAPLTLTQCPACGLGRFAFPAPDCPLRGPCSLSISCWSGRWLLASCRDAQGPLEIPPCPLLGLSREDGPCCPLASPSHMDLDPERGSGSWIPARAPGPASQASQVLTGSGQEEAGLREAAFGQNGISQSACLPPGLWRGAGGGGQ